MNPRRTGTAYVDPLPWTRQRPGAALDHAHCDAGGVLILWHVPPRAYTVAPRLDIFRPDQAGAVTGWKRLTLPYAVRGLHRRPRGLWHRENPALPAVGREPLGLVGMVTPRLVEKASRYGRGGPMTAPGSGNVRVRTGAGWAGCPGEVEGSDHRACSADGVLGSDICREVLKPGGGP